MKSSASSVVDEQTHPTLIVLRTDHGRQNKINRRRRGAQDLPRSWRGYSNGHLFLPISCTFPLSNLPSSFTDPQRKGIIYFLTHRTLWKPLQSRLLPTLTLGAGITSTLFFFTYVPQMAVLTLTSGPLLAPISAAFLVLSESAALTTTLARYFLRLDAAELDVFDATLICKGHESLVADGRLLRVGSDDDPIAKLGQVIKKMPLKGGSLSLLADFPSSLIRWLLYLPLNFVPVVGSVVFLTMQGRKIGPGRHERYFQLKGWGEKEKGEWVERNQARYTRSVQSLLFYCSRERGSVC